MLTTFIWNTYRFNALLSTTDMAIDTKGQIFLHLQLTRLKPLELKEKLMRFLGSEVKVTLTSQNTY